MEAISNKPQGPIPLLAESANADVREAATRQALDSDALLSGALPSAIPDHLVALKSRLDSWIKVHGMELEITPSLLAEAVRYLDPRQSPVPGVALTSVPGREALWDAVAPESSKALIAAAISLVRADGISGAYESNPFPLPPTPYLVSVVDSSADRETKDAALLCVQQNVRSRDKLGGEQWNAFLSAVTKYICAEKEPTAAIASTCSALRIKAFQVGTTEAALATARARVANKQVAA